jgi:hypothetical protein
MAEWGNEEGGLRQRWPHCKPTTDSVSAVAAAVNAAAVAAAVIGPPPSKRPHKESQPQQVVPGGATVAPVGPSSYYMPTRHIPGRAVVNHLNGKTKIATMTRVGSGRKQVISWTDAPDDMYFRATDNTK